MSAILRIELRYAMVPIPGNYPSEDYFIDPEREQSLDDLLRRFDFVVVSLRDVGNGRRIREARGPYRGADLLGRELDILLGAWENEGYLAGYEIGDVYTQSWVR